MRRVGRYSHIDDVDEPTLECENFIGCIPLPVTVGTQELEHHSFRDVDLQLNRYHPLGPGFDAQPTLQLQIESIVVHLADGDHVNPCVTHTHTAGDDLLETKASCSGCSRSIRRFVRTDGVRPDPFVASCC